MLTADGWDVVGEAEDGATALTAARDLSPEIVLLDLNLPTPAAWTSPSG